MRSLYYSSTINAKFFNHKHPKRKESKMAKQFNVPKGDLKTLFTPEPTRTWSPISHWDVVDQTEKALEDAGIAIISSRIDLNGKATYMFGTMVLDTPGTETSRFMLGYRNSTNKHLALGYTSGLWITNCSNMSFQGDFMTFQKHTSCLDLHMVHSLATEALSILPKYKKEMDEKLSQLNDMTMDQDSDAFKALIFDMLKANVIAPKNFNAFFTALQEEKNENKSRKSRKFSNNVVSLSDIYNGATRFQRTQSLEHLVTTTPKLNTFIDEYASRLAA